MSRPKPEIILESINKTTYKSEQVLSAEAIYSVFYQNKPINLRILHTLVSYPGPKYKKVSFSNPGHAFNLAEHPILASVALPLVGYGALKGGSALLSRLGRGRRLAQLSKGIAPKAYRQQALRLGFK